MSQQEWMIVATGALDAALGGLGLALLWRLRRAAPGRWEAVEQRLGALHRELVELVGRAEAQARDLDARLEGHAQRLARLLERVESTRWSPRPGGVSRASPARPRRGEGLSRDGLAERLRQLRAAGAPVERVAEELGVPVADARLLMRIHARESTSRREAAAG